MRRLVAVALLLCGAASARAGSPALDYMLHCQGCHLADGGGKPGAVPSLVDSVGRFLRVAGGREFLVRVPGSAQAPLSDADLAALLNWMVVRFGPAEVAASFRPFGGAEVGRLRRPPLTEVEATRRALIEAIEASQEF